jgi:DNA-binding XRE family transcriptional regulator
MTRKIKQADLFGGMTLPVRVESEKGEQFLISIVNGEMVDIADLHAVAGGLQEQSPHTWLREGKTKELMGILSQSLGLSSSRLVKTKQGKVVVHWQLALAYAKFLSSEIHLQINQIFRERLQELVDPELGLKRATQRAIAAYHRKGKSESWIEERLRGVMRRNHFTNELDKAGIRGWPVANYTNLENFALLGATAKEYRIENNLPKNARIRDHFSASQIAAFGLLEAVMTEHIQQLPEPTKRGVSRIIYNTTHGMAELYQKIKNPFIHEVGNEK